MAYRIWLISLVWLSVSIGGAAWAQDASAPALPADSAATAPADAPAYADDTLYIYPLQANVKAGEPVTVVVATGRTAHPLQFLTVCAVSVDAAGTYVPESFNYGAPGGKRKDADGLWALMGIPDGKFLDLGDDLQPGKPWEINGGRHCYSFAIVPMGQFPAPDAAGVLFNFQLVFDKPGTYRLGLQPLDGEFETLYYSDAANNNFHWGAVLADGQGSLSLEVAGLSNVISVE